MRLFIALDFDSHKDYFFSLQEKFRPLGSFSFPSSFHITLKFLGDVDDSKVGDIISCLGNVNCHRFSLSLAELGVFPDKNNARVLWIGVKPHEQVIALQKQVDSLLSQFFPIDPRFHPHITLARIKSICDRFSFSDSLNQVVEEMSFDFSSFNLVKSTLTAKGSVYEVVRYFSLSD